MTTHETEIAEVLRQIGEGRGHIDKQVALIAKLELESEDASAANSFLSRLEGAQQLYVDRLDHLEKQSALTKI